MLASVNTFRAASGDFAKAAETFSPSDTYKPAKCKMDVDLRKFPLIPYNTTQTGIGGDLRKFLFARPPRTACGFAKWEKKFLSIPLCTA